MKVSSLFTVLGIMAALASCAGHSAADTPAAVRKGETMSDAASSIPAPWSAEKAWNWYKQYPWLSGCNFIPSTASNELEMWQAGSWDPQSIERELGYAQNLGFNVMRVFLHYLAWKEDAAGFYSRLDQYLSIAQSRGIYTILVLNDSCWNPEPFTGPQPPPVPFRHNSQWLQSPGNTGLVESAEYAQVETYVRSTVRRYGQDRRVLLWDLLNEPDNDNGGRFPAELRNKSDYTYRLLADSFRWAREENPGQPLSAGLWAGDWHKGRLNRFNQLQTSESDVITFHNYDNKLGLSMRIAEIKAFGRPAICTEYMARPTGSTFRNCMPLLKKEGIGAINWGFVSGKTQTVYPWDSWTKDYSAEPALWFHDILRSDGSPYDSAECEFIRTLNAQR